MHGSRPRNNLRLVLFALIQRFQQQLIVQQTLFGNFAFKRQTVESRGRKKGRMLNKEERRDTQKSASSQMHEQG